MDIKGNKDQRLVCEILEDQLVIRIGIDTLAFCADFLFKEDVFSHNESTGQNCQPSKVCDAMQFAKDVALALLSEEEDGSSPLSNLFDSASRIANDDGSEGIEYPKGTT